MAATFGTNAVGVVTFVVPLDQILECVWFQLPGSILFGNVDAALFHFTTEQRVVAANGTLEEISGTQGQLLHADSVEPRMFLTAGGPQHIVIRIGRDVFVTDGAGGHRIQCPRSPYAIVFHHYVLYRLVFETVRTEGTKVLIHHTTVHTAGVVISLLTTPVATADGGPVRFALGAGQLPPPDNFFIDIVFQEAEDALVIFALLLQSRGEEQAVVVGAKLVVVVELAVFQFVVIILVTENAYELFTFLTG